MTVKSIHNVIAFMVDKEITYRDYSGNGILLLIGGYDLTDKQLRGLISTCFKNGFQISFDKNNFQITKSF